MYKYAHGDWNAICDRCGFQYKASELRGEWTGLMVCKECWEPRHPQEFIRGVKDDPSVPWTRTETDVPAITNHGDVSAVLTHSNDDNVQQWNVALTEDRLARLAISGAKKGDRYIIYKMHDDDQRLFVTSEVKDAGTSV